MIDHTPKLLDALDAFEDGIYMVNDDYTVEYMNDFMRALFGNGVGKKCHEVLSGSEKPCDWCNNNKVFKENKVYHSEVYVASVDKMFYLSELPVTNQDGTRSKLSIYRDITHRKHQEEKLKSSKESYQRLHHCEDRRSICISSFLALTLEGEGEGERINKFLPLHKYILVTPLSYQCFYTNMKRFVASAIQ